MIILDHNSYFFLFKNTLFLPELGGMISSKKEGVNNYLANTMH
jgi:hypothetical protein